jgi:hypothetical protein
VLQCPQCGQQFFVSTDGAEELASADDEGQTQTPEDDAKADADLSELRIRQVSDLRRGAIRSRSWLIVVAVACVVGAGQLIYLAVRQYHAGHRRGALRDVLCAAVALLIVPYLVRRIRQLGNEIRETRLKDPQTPPDFSTLSDGSQRWTNLEDLTGKNENRSTD